MTIWHRFELALNSPIGVIFLGLCATLLLLSTLFLYLLIQKRRRDLLAYRFQEHYARGDAFLQKSHASAASARAGFFAREMIVSDRRHCKALSLIPPPDLADATMVATLMEYYRAVDEIDDGNLSNYIVIKENDPLILIQQGVLTSRGKTPLSIAQYALDASLGSAECELLLLELSHTLQALHDSKSASGEPLYHGFLLPQMIKMRQRSDRPQWGITITDHGFAFAMGPESIAARVQLMRDGGLPIDLNLRRRLVSELPALAPEQTDPALFNHVGPRSDLYAFATLSLLLFTGTPFVKSYPVSLEKVPERWRSFLIKSLQEDPAHRPHDFVELYHNLEDPEFVLTTRAERLLNTEAPARALEPEKEEKEDLSELLGRLKTPNEHRIEADEQESRNEIKEIERLIQKRKWKKAFSLLEQEHQKAPNQGKILTLMAITCYEMGNQEAAELYYSIAKRNDPQAAKRFREHLTTRV